MTHVRTREQIKLQNDEWKKGKDWWALPFSTLILLVTLSFLIPGLRGRPLFIVFSGVIYYYIWFFFSRGKNKDFKRKSTYFVYYLITCLTFQILYLVDPQKTKYSFYFRTRFTFLFKSNHRKLQSSISSHSKWEDGPSQNTRGSFW